MGAVKLPASHLSPASAEVAVILNLLCNIPISVFLYLKNVFILLSNDSIFCMFLS